jgi:hypothetical protein
VYKDATAVKNEAKAKFKKNMLGVNSSKIIKPIPQTTKNSHKTIFSPYIEEKENKKFLKLFSIFFFPLYILLSTD